MIDRLDLERGAVRLMGRHAEALGRLWQARIELILSGWAQTLKRAERRASSGGSMAEDDLEEMVRRCERALRRMNRFVPGATCIHRALAAQRMLLRRRASCRIVIGLRRGTQDVEGHAWVEAGDGDRTVCAFFTDDAGYSPIRS